MATTTNYSWTTPDDTDLVKDGASAIRSLGSAIDSTVFTNAGNAVQKSTIDAKGDLLVGTADNTITRLAVGTNNYVLTADSAEASGVKWAAAAGGGKVLQVVQGTTTTATTNATNVYADTNLTATITPTLATSKVLVLVSQNGVAKRSGNAGTAVVLKLLRGATDIALIGGYTGWTNASDENTIGSASIDYLDAPATTSATTYKTQFKNDVNTTSVQVQQNSEVSTITLLEIGV